MIPIIYSVILLHGKFLQFDWLRAVVFELNLKYLHVEVLGTTILSNGKGHFGLTDRNDQTGQNGPPSNLVPNIPVGPNRNGPFHLMYQPKFLKSYVDKLSICGSHEKSRERSTRKETRVCRVSLYMESLLAGYPDHKRPYNNQAMSSLQEERLQCFEGKI